MADSALAANVRDAAGSAVYSTHCWPDENQPRFVICHGTGYDAAQTAAGVANDFMTTNPNSVHYAVDRAGRVVQVTRERDAAWGNGVITGPAGVSHPGDATAAHDAWWHDNPNRYTVSIEFVNDKGNDLGLTPAQQAAGFALIADICRRNHIPMQIADASGGVSFHYSIDPVNRCYCPGVNFPYAALKQYLAENNMRLVRNAKGMSEFLGENGDCTQDAELACLHAVDAGKYPMDAATLNGMVSFDHAQGWSAANGSETAQALAADLGTRGVPFHQVSDGSWVNEVHSWGGIKPMVIQVAHSGGNLPGDEPGVQGHAIALLGFDPSTGNCLCCDGDNSTPNRLVPYTLVQIEAAAPFCVTVVDVNCEDVSVANDQNLGAGFKAYADAHPELGAQVSSGEVATGDARYPGEAFAAFAGGTLYYTQAMGVRADRGPYLVWEFWQALQAERAAHAATAGQLAAADAEIAQLKAAQPAPAPTPAPVGPALPSDLQSTLVAVANILNPLAQAAADVARMQKELGF